MKKISITKNCNQCGICTVKCPEVFSEDIQGNIELVSENVDESVRLLAAVNSCPTKAIQILEGENSKSVINQYFNELEKLKKGITVTEKDIDFRERPIYLPYVGGSFYNYKSNRAATRAGLDVFESKWYSPMNQFILERITEYRVNVLKPYYSKGNNSVYTEHNRKIEKKIQLILNVIGKNRLSPDFDKINIYPDEDVYWEMLNKGTIVSDELISDVKNELDYKVSDYEVYINTDDIEDYRGKSMWRYDVDEAGNELAKDLGNAFHYAKNDIVGRAMEIVKWLVVDYNKKLAVCIDDKIKKLKQYC